MNKTENVGPVGQEQLPDAKKALTFLYNATRNLNVGAKVHEELKECATIVMKELTKEED